MTAPRWRSPAPVNWEELEVDKALEIDPELSPEWVRAVRKVLQWREHSSSWRKRSPNQNAQLMAEEASRLWGFVDHSPPMKEPASGALRRMAGKDGHWCAQAPHSADYVYGEKKDCIFCGEIAYEIGRALLAEQAARGGRLARPVSGGGVGG